MNINLPYIRLNKLVGWFQRTNIFLGGVIWSILCLIVQIVVHPIVEYIDTKYGVWNPTPLTNAGPVTVIILALILAPLIETFITQWIPFRIFHKYKWFQKYWWLIVIFSASLFGVQHCYSAGYVLWTFLVGLVLAFGFVFAGTLKRGFWTICITHFIINLAAAIANDRLAFSNDTLPNKAVEETSTAVMDAAEQPPRQP